MHNSVQNFVHGIYCYRVLYAAFDTFVKMKVGITQPMQKMSAVQRRNY